jgi:hypothetical protein
VTALGFERFGKVSYVSETKVKDFIDYLDKVKSWEPSAKYVGKHTSPRRWTATIAFPPTVWFGKK